jgi:tetratricopeptide (TPR) repeat protein
MKALSADENYSEATANLVSMDLQDRKPAAARDRANTALKRRPRDTRLLALASRTHAAVGDMPGAERLARAAIESDPANLDGYRLLGQLYVSQKRLAEATTQFQTIAERNPTSVSAQTIVGVLLDMQKKTADARARYERALRLDPHAAVAANNLAWLNAQDGQNLDIALQLAQVAKSRLPESPEVNDTLGLVYYKKGLHALAIPPFLSSTEKDPANADYHFHLGLAYAGAGDAVKARQSLERSVALNASGPHVAEAKRTLAALTGAKG